MRFEYIHEHAGASEIALYSRVMGVTPQGYAKYVQNLNRPYKYATLLADIWAILEEDEFNKNYGKQRIYEKLQLDYNGRL